MNEKIKALKDDLAEVLSLHGAHIEVNGYLHGIRLVGSFRIADCFVLCLVPLECIKHSAQRCGDGVWVDAHAPAVVAAVVAGFNISNCSGLRTLTERVLGVVLHVEMSAELTANGMHECIDWAVALADERLPRSIDVNLSGDFGIASDGFALQFMADQVIGRNLREIFVFECIPQHHRADFRSRVFSDVLNVLRELNLQASWKIEPMFCLHDVCNATLARLAIHTNN